MNQANPQNAPTTLIEATGQSWKLWLGLSLILLTLGFSPTSSAVDASGQVASAD